MKQFQKTILCLGLCMLASTPTFAQSNLSSDGNVNSISSNTIEDNAMETSIDISNIELGEIVTLPDGAVLTPISKEEYLSRLADEKNISLEEASRLESLNVNNSRQLYYYDYSKTFSHPKNPNFSAILQATLKMWGSGMYRQIEDVMAISSKRNSGLYTYRWIQTDAYSDPREGSASFPTTSVTLGAKGYFEVTTTSSLDISGDLPGFSLSSSAGWEYVYESETLSMRSTYSLY